MVFDKSQTFLAPTTSKPLPEFRHDLVLRSGPNDYDGSPTYTLFDPVTTHYYKLSWSEYQVYKRLQTPKTIEKLLHELNSDTSLELTKDDLIAYLQEAKANKLLRGSHESEKLITEHKRKKASLLLWGLYKYLYFRIPLINPNNFLDRTKDYVRGFYSKTALILYFVTILIAMGIIIFRFNEYVGTFYYFFNLKGIVAYVTAILAVKFIHEFSHAYVAKLLNVRVPSMGIAFIILWPVLFTDVTDSWKLKSRAKRFVIAFAGVGSEMVLAGFATIGWAVTQPGILNSTFFVVSSVTWISSLFMNLNPAMRFDGYYMFSDFLGIENLQTRAFELTRWKIRNFLWGIEVPLLEEGLPKRVVNTLIVYSIFTWIYRLFLYTSIAVLIYFKFTKSIGIILFLVEIIFFIIYPFVWEGMNLYKMRAQIKMNKSLTITTTCLLIFLGWFVLPWPHSENFPAITEPSKEQVIYAPYNGQVINVYVAEQDWVTKGDTIITIDSKEVDTELEEAKIHRAIEEEEIEKALTDEEKRSLIPEKKKRLAFFDTIISSLEEKKNQTVATAELDGTVYLLNDEITVGQHVYQGAEIAIIADLNKMKLVAYVHESFYRYIQEGETVTFTVKDGDRKKYQGVITNIAPLRVTHLKHPQLSSVYGEDLPVHSKLVDDQFPLAEAYFIVDIDITRESEDLSVGQVGVVSIPGPWRSKMMEWARYLTEIFWRESGF
jgi:putative peptide zinc metalloprotease protein